MSIRDYIGSENFRYDIEDTHAYKNKGNQNHKSPDGNSLFLDIIERVKKNQDRGLTGAKSSNNSSTAGFSNISH